jgi:hypothetical protein
LAAAAAAPATAEVSAAAAAAGAQKSGRGTLIAIAALAIAVAGGAAFFILRPQPKREVGAPPVVTSAPAPAPAPPAPTRPGAVNVLVDSVPVGAHIVLDGKTIGVTPEVVQVAPGAIEHVVLHKEGFADKPVTVDPALGAKLVVKLQRADSPKPAHTAHAHEAAHAHEPAAAASAPPSAPAAAPPPVAAAPPPAPPRREAHDPLTQRIDAEARTVAPGTHRVHTFQGSGPRTDWFVQLDGNRCYNFVGTVESGGLYLYLWGPGGRRLADYRSRTQVGTMSFCTAFPGQYHLQGKLAGGTGSYKLGVYQR